MKVCFETFGCRLNRAEALEDEADYIAKGWEVTHSHMDADMIVVRGCSVTSRAQRDCEKLIAHLKRKYPLKTLRVCGCLKVERKTALQAPLDITKEHAVPTSTARAYLKVQDGCDGKCAFCIVPQFRGASRSVPFQNVLDRAKKFLDAGYHEIVVTGCNLMQYLNGGKRLTDLTAALSDVCGATARLRFGSIEPGALAKDLVDVMAERKNVCRFLHLSVQSGSNRILTAMKRPYLVRDVDDIVEKAVRLMPEIGLGCDIMTGFPGETKIDHFATKGLLKRSLFSNVHVFPYSERPNTYAAGLPGAVHHASRTGRAHEIAALARQLREKAARRYLGKDVEIVVENEEKRSGWTGEYFACAIKTGRMAEIVKRKSLVPVHIMNIRGDTLYGVILGSPQIPKTA